MDTVASDGMPETSEGTSCARAEAVWDISVFFSSVEGEAGEVAREIWTRVQVGLRPMRTSPVPSMASREVLRRPLHVSGGGREKSISLRGLRVRGRCCGKPLFTGRVVQGEQGQPAHLSDLRPQQCAQQSRAAADAR